MYGSIVVFDDKFALIDSFLLSFDNLYVHLEQSNLSLFAHKLKL